MGWIIGQVWSNRVGGGWAKDAVFNQRVSSREYVNKGRTFGSTIYRTNGVCMCSEGGGAARAARLR
jgi:hypothetical protein